MIKKYEHAKKVIHELQRHEQFLAVQLQERDYEYNSHLEILRDRVLQLENELATTQKYAGIPVQLPYEKPLLNGKFKTFRSWIIYSLFFLQCLIDLCYD